MEDVGSSITSRLGCLYWFMLWSVQLGIEPNPANEGINFGLEYWDKTDSEVSFYNAIHLSTKLMLFISLVRVNVYYKPFVWETHVFIQLSNHTMRDTCFVWRTSTATSTSTSIGTKGRNDSG